MSVTISPAELGVLVDLALNSNAPVGRALQMGNLFQRATKLANSPGRIGEIITCDVPSALGAPVTLSDDTFA